jgi:glycosyltransferase involved in cell wall biosynthesis
MKIAIVHDWLYGGGAEKVVEALHEMYPGAPIYTTFVTPQWQKRLHGKVVTGYLGRWPFSRLHKFTPLLQQWWFAGLDLSEYDVVISSCGNGAARFACSKQNIEYRSKNIEEAQGRTAHIGYTHSPTHFYYRKYDEYLKSPGFRPYWLTRLGLKTLVGHLRKKDTAAAQKIDVLLANSTFITSDIKKYYGRESVVVHPPVDTVRFQNIEYRSKNIEEKPHNFVLWSRHVPYKRFDIAVETCNRLGLNLTVIGSGPETARLAKLAGPTVTMAGFVSDEELVKIASLSTAFLYPSDEDFGIAPVEAMAAGIPVIAFRAGGALDYVVPGVTGEFFDEQTVDSLVKVLENFDPNKYDSSKLRSKAGDFSVEVFKTKIKKIVEEHSESSV